MPQENPLSISGLPALLHWRGVPEKWHLEDGNILSITAGKESDWFIDPESGRSVRNAPALLMRAQKPCMLKALVAVDCRATFDAGVLAVYESDKIWAKLCLELSPQKQITVVSVVTKGVSDDCNSVPVTGNSIYLRIALLEHAIAFHYSADGTQWSLIRYFTLGESKDIEIGFLAQSPTGEGCTASFKEITYVAQKLSDVRSGI